MKLHCWMLLLCAGVVAMALADCSKREESAQSKAAAESIKPAAAHGPAAEVAQPAGTGLKFTTPPGWICETPSSSMRQGQYRLPHVEGDKEDAEMVVYYFQGGGGGVKANVDRWVGQFSKPDGSRPATSQRSPGRPFAVFR